MNTKMIRYILAKMLGVEAALLLLPAFVGVLYKESGAICFLIPSVILLVIYMAGGRKKPENATIYGKEGMVVVASAWILWCIWRASLSAIRQYTELYRRIFETVSGFTTTGSSILRDVEVLPQCMHFWRSFTHWVGGMGVLVFVMVLTSLDKKNSMYLIRAEVPDRKRISWCPRRCLRQEFCTACILD